MASESIVDIQEEGAARSVVLPSVLAAAKEDGAEGVEIILALIQDPDSDISDITRLIAVEIAKVLKKMTTTNVLDRGVISQKDLIEQVKGWQALQRTLSESDTQSKKDMLNLDGPKFGFAFKEMVRWFQESLKDSGVDPSLEQNIMLQFGDSVKRNNETLRRELNKI